jgi:translation initiation factor IF-3
MRNQRQFERNVRMNPEQEHTANGWIRTPTVRLIGEDGENLGIIDTKAAMSQAVSLGLDLITVSKDATPPVCRIYDLSKWIYEQKKVKKELDKKNRENAIIVKELQLRPGINEHDLLVKQRHAKEFLEENNKIKIIMKFRGREMAFTKRGFDLMRKFIEGLGEHKVEKDPSLAGNTIMAILAPPPRPVKT